MRLSDDGVGIVDLHWERIAYGLLRADHRAPSARKVAKYAMGDPTLNETGAPPPIWCVHVALLRAHKLAAILGTERYDVTRLAPLRGETEVAWVDRAATALVRWAERMSRSRIASASRNVIEAEPSQTEEET